jgi:hypothetical protein
MNTGTPWNDDMEVLAYLKGRGPIFHQSNIFFRDIQFGIQQMLEERGKKQSYAEAERLARGFVERLEARHILRAVDRQTWVVYHEDYKTPPAKPAAAVPSKP